MAAIEEFDPISADFNELVARGSVHLKTWRMILVQVMNEGIEEGDLRWRGFPAVIARYDKAIKTAIGIETGRTPPPIVINAKVATMGVLGARRNNDNG